MCLSMQSSNYQKILHQATNAETIYCKSYKGGTLYALINSSPSKTHGFLDKAIISVDQMLMIQSGSTSTSFQTISIELSGKVKTFQKGEHATNEYYNAIFSNRVPGGPRKLEVNPGVETWTHASNPSDTDIEKQQTSSLISIQHEIQKQVKKRRKEKDEECMQSKNDEDTQKRKREHQLNDEVMNEQDHKRALEEEKQDRCTREKLMEYVYGDSITRLTLEPTLHRLLEPQYPDRPTRAKFIESLAINGNKQTVEYAGVYVLRVTGMQYTHYVGCSRTVIARIEQHRRGVGAACTMGVTSIESLPLLTKGSTDDLDSWERTETLALMYTIGIDKVRGWHFTNKLHSDEDRRHINSNICSYNRLCHRCGFGSHMVTKCYARSRSYWMGGGLLDPTSTARFLLDQPL